MFVKGARVSVKTFRTKREAVLWHEKEQCKFTFNPASLNDQMTFKECLDRFFEDAKTRIMKVTFQRYEQHAVYLYNTPLAKTKMSELKGVKIVEWIDWLKKHPTAKSLKRNSFVEELRCLKTVLFWYKNFLNEDLNVPITKKHKDTKGNCLNTMPFSQLLMPALRHWDFPGVPPISADTLSQLLLLWKQKIFPLSLTTCCIFLAQYQ